MNKFKFISFIQNSETIQSIHYLNKTQILIVNSSNRLDLVKFDSSFASFVSVASLSLETKQKVHRAYFYDSKIIVQTLQSIVIVDETLKNAFNIPFNFDNFKLRQHDCGDFYMTHNLTRETFQILFKQVKAGTFTFKMNLSTNTKTLGFSDITQQATQEEIIAKSVGFPFSFDRNFDRSAFDVPLEQFTCYLFVPEFGLMFLGHTDQVSVWKRDPQTMVHFKVAESSNTNPSNSPNSTNHLWEFIKMSFIVAIEDIRHTFQTRWKPN